MLFLEICDLSKTTFPDRKKHSRNNSFSPVPDDLTGTASPAGDGDFDQVTRYPSSREGSWVISPLGFVIIFFWMLRILFSTHLPTLHLF